MNRNCVIKDPAPGNRAQWRRSSAASAHERLAFLNEASRRIGSTLDLSETSRELVDVAVPRFADAAAVMVQDRLMADGELSSRPVDGTTLVRRVALGVAGADPDAWMNAFPVGETTVYPAILPQAQCMAGGKPLMYPALDKESARLIGASLDREEAVTSLLTDSSFLAVPLRARGRVLGCVIFTRHPGSLPFEEQDVVVAEDLAARTALCVDNARLYTRERRTALTLQSSLLPVELPQALGMDIASRYLPASDLMGVGGDWYDVIALPGCRTALVVGDVMGHGTRAAATMGQLRTAARTLASLDLPPDEVLFRLNLMSQDLDPSQIATCIYAVYDPVTRNCALARAGHVPPILLHPDRSTEIIELPSGLPLGIGSDPLESRELILPPGSVLALYTDGLVESRERDLDAGIMGLRRLLAGPIEDLEDMCDVIISSQRSGHERDDIALMVAQVRDLDPDEVATCPLPSDPRFVSHARRFVRGTLQRWGLSSLVDSTQLIVSELVTNALKHGWPPIELRMLRGRTLVVEVVDGSPAAPTPRTATLDEDTGRGLQLIKRFAYRWGTRPTPYGKIVWVEQHLP
ncbi:SpoIIE family protein phosphatase [Microbispora sp. KK1-11]|uniref:ATP-binding SpoIIE family protein phosphatase n=1 Tax=Microbispora sp. KK1-11 TaxID=2053005 RepID=UPI00115BE913|nr:SpoIIE family protein phosphatase [Microbispora sp. KK1-11]TQS30261.1 SpoIIE family protein phosphatase [Microbispora sp. KK1-11]